MKSSNTTSIDSGLNFAMTWYNSASRSSSSSSNGYNSGSEESSYSSSGYYASSTSSRSPERAPRIKKKCKKATKNLDETDFLSSNAGPEMCNDLELKYGCFN